MTTYNNQQRYQTEPTLSELLSDLSAKTSRLVRKEVALAKAEMSQKATKAGREIGILVVAGLLANAALLVLLAGIVLIVGIWLPLWAAALIVGGLLALLAGGLAWSGIQALTEIDPMPNKTIQTLQEDKEWLTAQMS